MSSELEAAVLALVEQVRGAEASSAPGPLSETDVRRVLRRHPRDGRGFHGRSELIAAFRALSQRAALGVSERSFVERLQLRPVRTHSGVTPVTVLTKPYPCPGTCVFCPNDVRMPKSYLAREPGCQRAEQNGFDPYLQTFNRLRAFSAMGHGATKAELIILGGTFSAYPERYQRWFIMRCFDAMNDYGAAVDGRAGATPEPPLAKAERAGDGPQVDYNVALRTLGRGRLHAHESADAAELSAAQRRNETAACRNVGLSIETRPDAIDEREVLALRALGCTKVQLGVQSLSDAVLTANKRGHDVAATRRAMHLLRAAGFKLQVHVMPNLLGSSPDDDVADFRRLFDEPDFRPDELKVYPCSLIAGTELAAAHVRGEFRPYSHEELLAVLCAVLEHTPRYCRLSRVIRDISSEDILVGNRRSNFRELADAALSARGVRCVDVRSREVRHGNVQPSALGLRTLSYATSVGDERFLELVTPDDRLAGLLRLALPTQPSFVPELSRAAVIRELHVYGSALALGEQADTSAQHRGLGRRLLTHAASLAKAAGHDRLAVISAVGTRGYYRRLGFTDGALYQHLAL